MATNTAKKTESRGFNLDSLQNQSIDQLINGYDQVEVKNGNQSLLLNRASQDGYGSTGTSATGTTNPVDISAAGNLQIVPTVGGKAQAYAQSQATAAAAAGSHTSLLLPLGLGLAGVVVLFFLLKR